MLPIDITPFLYENGGENIRFCPFTLILLITNTEPKKSVFVRSHCSGSVKSIVEHWRVFKHLRFCAFTLIQSDFKNLRFCGYPLSIAFSKTSIFYGVFVQINVHTFTKMDIFLSVFAQKWCSVNGALKNVYLSESKLNYQERNWSLKNKQWVKEITLQSKLCYILQDYLL